MDEKITYKPCQTLDSKSYCINDSTEHTTLRAMKHQLAASWCAVVRHLQIAIPNAQSAICNFFLHLDLIADVKPHQSGPCFSDPNSLFFSASVSLACFIFSNVYTCHTCKYTWPTPTWLSWYTCKAYSCLAELYVAASFARPLAMASAGKGHYRKPSLLDTQPDKLDVI